MTFTDAQKWAVFMIHLEVKNNLRVSGLGRKSILLARGKLQSGVATRHKPSV